MLEFIWYLVGGFVVVYASVFIHLVRAWNKGYDVVKYWKEQELENEFEEPMDYAKFAWGLIIWPVRLIEFLDEIPDLYEQYELR